MNPETENNAHLALHGTVAASVFFAVVTVFFPIAPYHEMPAAAIVAPPGNCLPSGTGGPCLPFDKIQEMMNTQPDAPEVVPPNPATANEEKI
jgi:hypothetical protein